MDWISEDYDSLLTGTFLGIAFYNSLELFIFIFHTFQRNEGLYFWSMLCTDTGIITHTVGVMLTKTVSSMCPVSIIVTGGWYLMVIGQSVVLYSRLHLVVVEPRKILWTLVMIIVVAILVVTPTAVFFIGASLPTELAPFIGNWAELAVKVQAAMTTVQDSIISGLYVYEARRALKMIDPIKGHRVRAMNRNLVALFILSVALDLAVTATVFLPMPKFHAVFKPFAYSVNLKVEAVVLNSLVTLLRSSSSSIWDLATVQGQSSLRNLPRHPAFGDRRPSFVRSLAVNEFLATPPGPKMSSRDTMDTAVLMDVTKWGVYSRRPTGSGVGWV